MKRVLKWVGMAFGVLALLGLVALAFIYIRSEQIFDRTYDVPLTSFTVSSDSMTVAEGKRLATIRGCFNGCHGEELEGGVFFDEPAVARLVAPDLTRMAAEASDAELERVIRHGVRRDGTSTFAMPSSMFYNLSDEDLNAIIAFLRSAPPSEGPATEVRMGPLARLGLVIGQYVPQAATIDHTARPLGAEVASDPAQRGRYLALTICTECHGMDFQGDPGMGATNLAAVAAYSEEDFAHLMRTGTALGGRTLGLMSEVALGRFVFLTDEEIRALHGYLKTLAAAAPVAEATP